MYVHSFFDPCFPAENMLLLTCARTWAGPEEVVEILDPSLNWVYIMEIAAQNRTDPLLFHNLEKVDAGLVPPEVMGSLRVKYFAIAKRDLLALYELSQILKSFLEEQIETIVLKGVALSQTVYRDTVPRPFYDIDLLILKEDRRKVEERLSQLGYELLADRHPGFAQQFRVELCYARENSMPVDLHWHIVDIPYSGCIDIDSFWKSAVPLGIEGMDALALSPENLMIHLCLHVSKEHYPQLLWLVDISEVIRYYRKTLDWKLILERTEEYKVRPLMFHVLGLVDELFHPPMPASVLEQLTSSRSLSFEAKLFDALADPRLTQTEKLGIARFLKLSGTHSKLKYILGVLFPSKSFLLRKYSHRAIHRSFCLRIWNALREITGFVRATLRILLQNSAKEDSGLQHFGVFRTVALFRKSSEIDTGPKTENIPRAGR